MLLPESVLWGLEPIDTQSGVRIYCKDSEKSDIIVQFTATFVKKWDDLLDQVEEDMGSCQEKENEYCPFESAIETDYGVFVSLTGMAIYNTEGQTMAEVSGDQALEETLKEIKATYPEITYDGYIGYVWSDFSGGDVVQYELQSEGESTENKVYDFVGAAIQASIEEDEDHLLDNLMDSDDEEAFLEVVRWMALYKEWLPDDFENRFFDLVKEEEFDSHDEYFYEGSVEWDNKKINVMLGCDSETEELSNACIVKLKELIVNASEVTAKAKAMIADDLLENANDWQEDGPEITREEFMDRITISSVVIYEDCGYGVGFEDDGIFLGHYLEAVFTVDGAGVDVRMEG